MQETMKSTQILYPALRYADAARAIAWLCETFGFEEAVCYRDDDGVVVHAELRFKNNLVMLGSDRRGGEYPVHAPKPGALLTGSIYVAVPKEEIDEHYERARAGGTRMLHPLRDTDYGSREYAAYDCEGHLWSFGTYHP
jgi:uncharacterized glyoxalase superfamily protein PhnB